MLAPTDNDIVIKITNRTSSASEQKTFRRIVTKDLAKRSKFIGILLSDTSIDNKEGIEVNIFMNATHTEIGQAINSLFDMLRVDAITATAQDKSVSSEESLATTPDTKSETSASSKAFFDTITPMVDKFTSVEKLLRLLELSNYFNIPEITQAVLVKLLELQTLPEQLSPYSLIKEHMVTNPTAQPSELMNQFAKLLSKRTYPQPEREAH